MSTHYTPTPWSLEATRMVLGRDFTGQWKAICDRVRGGSPVQADANARLIAAAPDLYEALNSAMQYLDETIGPCEDGCECILHDLHAALNKADGGTRTI